MVSPLIKIDFLIANTWFQFFAKREKKKAEKRHFTGAYTGFI